VPCQGKGLQRPPAYAQVCGRVCVHAYACVCFDVGLDVWMKYCSLWYCGECGVLFDGIWGIPGILPCLYNNNRLVHEQTALCASGRNTSHVAELKQRPLLLGISVLKLPCRFEPATPVEAGLPTELSGHLPQTKHEMRFGNAPIRMALF